MCLPFAALIGCGDDETAGSGTTGAGNAGTGGTGNAGGAGNAGGTGGGAACETDICQTYGAAVPDVVSAIVDNAAADPEFMDDFAPLVAEGPAAVTAFKASLTAFISDAYGCTTGTYSGPTMEDAHAGMGITAAQYDDFLGIIVEELLAAGVPEDDVNLCFAPALLDPAFRATIEGQ